MSFSTIRATGALFSAVGRQSIARVAQTTKVAAQVVRRGNKLYAHYKPGIQALGRDIAAVAEAKEAYRVAQYASLSPRIQKIVKTSRDIGDTAQMLELGVNAWSWWRQQQQQQKQAQQQPDGIPKFSSPSYDKLMRNARDLNTDPTALRPGERRIF